MRQIVFGTPLASMASAVRASKPRSRRRSACRPTPAAVCCDPAGPVRCRARSASSSRDGRARRSPLRRPTALPVHARPPRTPRLRRHAGRRLTRATLRPVAPGSDASTRSGPLSQVQVQLPLVESSIASAAQRAADVLRGAQPRGTAERTSASRTVITVGPRPPGTRRPGFVQRRAGCKHRPSQDPWHHAAEKVLRPRRGLHQRPGGIRQLREPVGRRLRHPSRHRHGPRRSCSRACGQLAGPGTGCLRFGVHLAGRLCQAGSPRRPAYPRPPGGQATKVTVRVGIRRQTRHQPALVSPERRPTP